MFGEHRVGLYWKFDPRAPQNDELLAFWFSWFRAYWGFWDEFAPTKVTVFWFVAYWPKVLVMLFTTVVNVFEGSAL